MPSIAWYLDESSALDDVLPGRPPFARSLPRRRAVDDVDLRLIALLREDARQPVARLAAALGVSRGTVQNRIDRLVARGVLLGFTVRTTPDAARHRVRAVMLIEVDGERSSAILRVLRGYPEVTALHTTNGRWDIVAELGTDGLEAFDRVLRRVREIKGVANSETSLLLSTHKV
jgi:DNA-binding Lrp family transcriptional regulator